MFVKSKQQELDKVAQEQKAKMQADCDFWTNCVQYMIDEETIGAEATRRVIASADQLLAARRERFI